MNTSHYPSLELCKKLDLACFPMTEEFITELVDGVRYNYVMPNVMEMLDVITLPLHHKLEIEKQYDFDDGYWYRVCFHSRYALLKGFQDEYLSNALAEMILWLHEHKYITFSKG